MARLGEICSINMGQSPESSTYNAAGDGLPFFQGNADFSELHPTVRVWCNAPIKIAKPNDILISVRAPIGALNIADTECCIGRGLAALTVNPALCNQKYLWYGLENKVEELNSKGTGSTFKAISKNILSETEIPLPPLTEQESISTALDKVSKLIVIRKQQLAKLDELVKARFVELFGDPATNPRNLEIVSLSKIAVFFNGLTYTPSDVSKDGTIVLRSSNIQNGMLDFTDTVRVSCAIKDKYMVQDNDILMCSRNGSARLVGKVAPISNISEPMCFGAFMMIVRSKYAPYLLTYFQTDAFREQIKTGATTTINQITVQMLGNVYLPIPTIQEVEEYTGYLNHIEKCKLTIRQGLDKLEMLKKALMQEYFGERKK